MSSRNAQDRKGRQGWTLKLPCSNNEWVAASSKETFQTVNPATGKHLVDVAHASKDDVDTAVKAARKAFKTTWGLKVPGNERGALLLKLADLMERDQDKLAAVESLNSGKGIRIARQVGRRLISPARRLRD